MNRVLCIVIAATLLTVDLALAGTGECAANEILNSNLGAGAMGSGGAASCRVDPLGAIQTNPAGLSFLTNSEFFTSYNRNLFETQHTFLGFAKSFAPRSSVWAVSAATLSDETILLNLTNPDGSLKETRSVRSRDDYLLILSYSQMWGKNVSAGLNAKLLQSTLASQYKATAYAVDTGFLFRPAGKRISCGLSARNLGTGLKYIEEEDDLQREFTAGIALRLLETKAQTLALMGDRVINEKNRTHLGVEYTFHERLILRAGYKFGYDLDTFTAGFGINSRNMGFDYAVVNNRIFDNSQVVSVRMKFGDVSHYDAGRNYFNRGMFENAISEWLKVQNGHPDFKKAAESVDEAKKYMQADELYKQGENFFQIEKYEEALVEFEKLEEFLEGYKDIREKIQFIKNLQPANLKNAILEMEKELIEATNIGFDVEEERGISSLAFGAFMWNNYKLAREKVDLFWKTLNASYRSGAEKAIADVNAEQHRADEQDIEVPDAYRRFGEIKQIFADGEYKSAKIKTNQLGMLIAERLRLNQEVESIVGAAVKRGIEVEKVVILAKSRPMEDKIAAEKFYEWRSRDYQPEKYQQDTKAATAGVGSVKEHKDPPWKILADKRKAPIPQMPTTEGKTLAEIEKELETADGIRQKLENLGGIFGATVKRGIEIERVSILAQARSLGFKGKSVTVSGEGREILHNIGKLLTESRPERIRVIGHRYDMGDAESNKKISLEQAEAVREHYIEKENISGEIIEATGMGDTQMLDDSPGGRLDRVDTVFLAASDDLQVSKQLKKITRREDVSVQRVVESVETIIFASEKAVYFEPDSLEIKQSSLLLLDRICDVLEILPECEVNIITAGSDTAEDNVHLFFQRAEEVVQYFVDHRKLSAEKIRVRPADFWGQPELKGRFKNDELIITLRWEYQ
ncbi:MAG: PorV/PorQ family protein [Elusimicrobiota bacterium]|nr:PorV/PorQ family protein [Elusimicrobiota bacterium]